MAWRGAGQLLAFSFAHSGILAQIAAHARIGEQGVDAKRFVKARRAGT
jgi:hypothetical protein